MKRHRLRNAGLAIIAAMLLGATSAHAVTDCATKGVKELSGAGSTFDAPLFSKMFEAYGNLCGVKIKYQAIGSGGGIKQLQQTAVDFAASDGIMSAEQAAQAQGGPVLHVPVTVGAEAVVFNVPGISRGGIRLTPDLLADIYLKKIVKWNDKRIAALNPEAPLPNLNIVVVHRSDGSGTTFIFTDYLSKVSPDWATKVGSATSVTWPGDVGVSGTEAVANEVLKTPGSIGYVELAYAMRKQLAWALIRNKAGLYVEPSLRGAAEAADVPALPDDMKIMITNSANPEAYPISGFSWVLVYANQKDLAHADAVGHLVWWMIHGGQIHGGGLLYARLDAAAAKKAEALLKQIKVGGRSVLATP